MPKCNRPSNTFWLNWKLSANLHRIYKSFISKTVVQPVPKLFRWHILFIFARHICSFFSIFQYLICLRYQEIPNIAYPVLYFCLQMAVVWISAIDWLVKKTSVECGSRISLMSYLPLPFFCTLPPLPHRYVTYKFVTPPPPHPYAFDSLRKNWFIDIKQTKVELYRLKMIIIFCWKLRVTALANNAEKFLRTSAQAWSKVRVTVNFAHCVHSS